MSRAHILASIRRGLDPNSKASSRQAAAHARLAQPVAHPRPSGGGDLVQVFKERQRTLGVDLIEADAMTVIGAAIGDYLGGLGLLARLRCGADPLWDALSAETLIVDRGPAQASDAVGLSRALAGVAETGTLVLASGADNPVTLGFLPDTHIVVLRAADIVAHYEDGMALARNAMGGAMPRTLNLVTGASRTGDIGGKIVMGAHGPRRLAVVIVGKG